MKIFISGLLLNFCSGTFFSFRSSYAQVIGRGGENALTTSTAVPGPEGGGDPHGPDVRHLLLRPAGDAGRRDSSPAWSQDQRAGGAQTLFMHFFLTFGKILLWFAVSCSSSVRAASPPPGQKQQTRLSLTANRAEVGNFQSPQLPGIFPP